MSKVNSLITVLIVAVLGVHAATPAIAGTKIGIAGKEEQEKKREAFMQKYLWEMNQDNPIYKTSISYLDEVKKQTALEEVEQFFIENAKEIKNETIESFVSAKSMETTYSFTLQPSNIMLDGDARESRNNTGSLITGISAAQQINRTFDFSDSSPIIWARFYPNRNMGYIQLFQMRQNTHSPSLDINQRLNSPNIDIRNAALREMVSLERVDLGPEMGNVLARGNNIKRTYNGVNPFQPFIESSMPSRYVNMSLGAFKAAVGVWASHFSTTRGYLAIADVNVQQFSWSERRRLFRRTFHTEATATVSPRWFALTAFDNASGRPMSTGFMSSNCRASGGTEEQCVVVSPVGFIEISRFSDVPHEPFRFWHQHQSRTGWALGFFMVIVFFVSFLFPPISVGLNAVLNAGILALGYGAVSIIMSGGGSINSIQSGLLGRLSNGYEARSSAGDPNWNPDFCGTTGSRSPGWLLRGGGGRHGNYECINWLGRDPATLHGPVGDFFRSRAPNVEQDFNTHNSIEFMRNNNTRPRAFDGAPVRN